MPPHGTVRTRPQAHSTQSGFRLERFALTNSEKNYDLQDDDSKVLSQINPVFATSEAANKYCDTPHSKKVVYAYFGGQPNHP
jgi:hypothetical protein